MTRVQTGKSLRTYATREFLRWRKKGQGWQGWLKDGLVMTFSSWMLDLEPGVVSGVATGPTSPPAKLSWRCVICGWILSRNVESLFWSRRIYDFPNFIAGVGSLCTFFLITMQKPSRTRACRFLDSRSDLAELRMCETGIIAVFQLPWFVLCLLRLGSVQYIAHPEFVSWESDWQR